MEGDHDETEETIEHRTIRATEISMRMIRTIPPILIRFLAVIRGYDAYGSDADAEAYLLNVFVGNIRTLNTAGMDDFAEGIDTIENEPDGWNDTATVVRSVMAKLRKRIEEPSRALSPLTFRTYAPPIREANDEAALTQAFAAHLAQRGERVAIQVACPVGIADIVTDRAVYEVKHWLTRPNFLSALGQVLLYREAINPSLRAVIVGFIVPSVPLDTLVYYANRLNVEVVICSSQ